MGRICIEIETKKLDDGKWSAKLSIEKEEDAQYAKTELDAVHFACNRWIRHAYHGDISPNASSGKKLARDRYLTLCGWYCVSIREQGPVWYDRVGAGMQGRSIEELTALVEPVDEETAERIQILREQSVRDYYFEAIGRLT